MYSLREMQMLAEAQFSVEDSRRDLNHLVQFFQNLPGQKEFLEIAFVNERKLPKEIAIEQKIFFVPEEIAVSNLPEEFQTEALGMVKNGYLVFEGRLVYPVMDVKKNVMGFCGWDKFVQPKYLDSKNHGYKAKATTFYGMEKLEEYYKSEQPFYVVEGIVCCLYLRSRGLQAGALLGSSITPYVAQVLQRFQERLILIPDNDAIGKSVEELAGNLSGEHLVKQAKRLFPKARVIQSQIAKDVDDSRLITQKEALFLAELQQAAKNPFSIYQTIRVR